MQKLRPGARKPPDCRALALQEQLWHMSDSVGALVPAVELGAEADSLPLSISSWVGDGRLAPCHVSGHLWARDFPLHSGKECWPGP